MYTVAGRKVESMENARMLAETIARDYDQPVTIQKGRQTIDTVMPFADIEEFEDWAEQRGREDLLDITFDIGDQANGTVDYLAAAQAVQGWSTTGEDLLSDYADRYEDLFSVAESGDWLAVEGELVWEGGDPKNGSGTWDDVDIPEGYVETNIGGWMSEEIEVDRDFVEKDLLKPYKHLSGPDADIVAWYIDQVLPGKEQFYTTIQGEVTVYGKPVKD